MTKLLIIGDIGIDFIMGSMDQWPEVGTETLIDRTEIRSGFSAANAALAARHFGRDCQLVGAIGDDDMGRNLRETLGGIDARLVVVPDTATTLTVALVRSDGERSFLTTRGHLEKVEWEDILAEVEDADPGDIALLTGFFLLPGLRVGYEESLSHLRGLGYRIAIDTGWPPGGWTPAVRAELGHWLPLCDILLLNEIEVTGLSDLIEIEPALRKLAASMAASGIAVAKLGATGAAAVQAEQLARGSAPVVKVFDTVGAGDSFNAAFLAALQNGLALEAALSAGCAGASSIISHFPRSGIAPGALASIVAAPPRADALDSVR